MDQPIARPVASGYWFAMNICYPPTAYRTFFYVTCFGITRSH
jgi:hypothetical protein